MSNLTRRNAAFLFLVIALSALPLARPAFAKYNGDARDEPQNLSVAPVDPDSMEKLQELDKEEAVIGKRQSDHDDNLAGAVKEEKDLALKIRRDSMREAALSFGARGGLAWRTKMIMDELKKSEPAMDKVYNFRRLLIQAPSNMYIEPPIISEGLNNFIVSASGDEAAVSDAVYHISRQARIVSSPRNWRQYLDRVWDKVVPPPDVLRPENAAERKAWRAWVREGWRQGYDQADETFQADLNRLDADFQGMVRYRVLLTQNKVTLPYATMVDRGVSSNQIETKVGDKPMKVTNEMRIGDRAIRITEPVTLRPDNAAQNWETPEQAEQ